MVGDKRLFLSARGSERVLKTDSAQDAPIMLAAASAKLYPKAGAVASDNVRVTFEHKHLSASVYAPINAPKNIYAARGVSVLWKCQKRVLLTSVT